MQNTARGIRKWLSVSIAFVFSEKVMCLSGYATVFTLALRLLLDPRIFSAKASEED